MLRIQINHDAGAAKLSAATPIKAGGGVPVALVFEANPGEITGFSLALSAQSSTPAVLAYLDVFDRQNSTLYTGTLNANDVRLLSHLAGKAAQSLDCELAVTRLGSAKQVFPNFSVTVQQPIVQGPTASEGGPVWTTEAPEDGKAYVRQDGGWVEAGAFASPDGSVWKLRITNDGVLETIKL